MIDIKAIERRRELRLEILEELYSLYFSFSENNGLVVKSNELYEKRNSEKHLAYHYLLTSEYITIDVVEEYSSVMITEKGIDLVENIYIKNNI